MRAVILLSFAVWFWGLGCAARQKGECPAGCKLPEFSLSFHPRGDEPPLSLSESSGEVSLVLWMGAERKGLVEPKKYLALKDGILRSQIWQEEATEHYFSGPFSGSPRDILVVRSGRRGICLQGEKVPKEWRRLILALVPER